MTNRIAECESAVDVPQPAEKWRLPVHRRTEDFLATLGHEMRNPLSALSYAVEAWPHHDPVEMEETRQIIRRQVRQLLRLSDGLLDVARIAEGKLELRREQVGLRQLIDGACEEIRPFIDRCGHRLAVQMPAEPLWVFGDESRLLQVFANLLQNAAKFSDRNGALRITVETKDGMAVVRVRDNGRGIETHMLSAIFEPYMQANGTRTAASDGLGLGLPLVRSIVELHGGDVTAHSNGPGKGSEFKVRLPLVPVLHVPPTEAGTAD